MDIIFTDRPGAPCGPPPAALFQPAAPLTQENQMPRDGKLIQNGPISLTHPDTGKKRTAVSKVDLVTAEAAGFVQDAVAAAEKPASERTDEEKAAVRAAAAAKAAETRRANAAAKAAEKDAAKSGSDAAVDSPTTPGTTETPGSTPDDADTTSA